MICKTAAGATAAEVFDASEGVTSDSTGQE